MPQTILVLKQICGTPIYIRNTANLNQWLQVHLTELLKLHPKTIFLWFRIERRRVSIC